MAYRSAPRPLSPGKTIRAVLLYGQGMSLRKIAALMHRDAEAVKAALLNAGIEIRPVGRPERQPPHRKTTIIDLSDTRGGTATGTGWQRA